MFSRNGLSSMFGRRGRFVERIEVHFSFVLKWRDDGWETFSSDECITIKCLVAIYDVA